MGTFTGARKRTTTKDKSLPAVPATRSRNNHPVWQAMREGGDPKAEQTYIYTLAITGDPMAAYRAGGYPLTDMHGNPVADSTISRRARELAEIDRIKQAVAETRRSLTASASCEWTREEVLDGYRMLYKAAVDNLETVVRDDFGGEIYRKYNERAAGNAATILDRVTQMYGFNAPTKVDGEIRFVFSGNGSSTDEQDKKYDYEGAANSIDISAYGK